MAKLSFKDLETELKNQEQKLAELCPTPVVGEEASSSQAPPDWLTIWTDKLPELIKIVQKNTCTDGESDDEDEEMISQSRSSSGRWWM